MRNVLLITVFILGLTTPRALYACGVCFELPEASVADHILSAQVIVLAGPASDNPFRYGARKILKGTSANLEAAPDIPFLVDSVTRRVFKSEPTTTVLLTYGPNQSNDPKRSLSMTWRRIFIMNPDRSEFLERLRTNSSFWADGVTGKPERVSFFADYLWHPDQALHDLALIELDRAPYAFVRSIEIKSSTGQILSELGDLSRFAFRSVAIRLLGLQTDPEALSIVRSRFAQSLKAGGLDSHAWALAGIEVDGSKAIRAIGLTLGRLQRTSEDRKSLIRALTDAGSAQSELRPKIAPILSEVLQRDQGLALQIALETRSWSEAVLHQQFGAIATQEETDPATQFAIKMVLGTDVTSD